GGLFEGRDIEPDEDIGLPPLPKIAQLALDYGRVGLSVHDHPMAHLRTRLAERGVRRAEELKAIRHGEIVTVAGLVIGRQRPGTASGVTFFTLEDETGNVNLIVQGRLERQGEVIHVLAAELTRLALPEEGEGLEVRSRDFH